MSENDRINHEIPLSVEELLGELGRRAERGEVDPALVLPVLETAQANFDSIASGTETVPDSELPAVEREKLTLRYDCLWYGKVLRPLKLNDRSDEEEGRARVMRIFMITMIGQEFTMQQVANTNRNWMSID